MATTSVNSRTENYTILPDTAFSTISWPAIISGAVAAVGLTLIMLTLGSGLGFASISPWRGEGASLGTLSMMAVIWLFVVQWLSSSLGGFIAGRLRPKTLGIRSRETAFRDSVHGMLTWAVSTIFMAMLFTSAATSVISGFRENVSDMTAGAMQGGAQAVAENPGLLPRTDDVSATTGYYVDSLFRSEFATNPNVVQQADDENSFEPIANAAPEAPDQNVDYRAETSRILALAATNGKISEGDRDYLTRMVAARTGVGAEEASTRVDNVLANINEARMEVKQTADEAAETASRLSIFTALSLLIGAFVGCVAGALGGRVRDDLDLIPGDDDDDRSVTRSYRR